jgi:hypothetical protein
MLDKTAAFPDESSPSDLELNSVTPGQIADLCHIQQRIMKGSGGGKNVSYAPLNPYTQPMPSASRGSNLGEDGRLDVRVFALKEKLEKFGGESVSQKQKR